MQWDRAVLMTALWCAARTSLAAEPPASQPGAAVAPSDAAASQPAIAATRPASLSTQPSADLWDSSRYMRVSEVRPGMAGYGLTVFSGTTIEKFDVQVVDLLRNFNPKCDVVLISCKGDFLQHTGAVAGMSGSPIFLYDPSDSERKHPRMIGAFAYGWPMDKDPLAGVQPIEYMLSIPPNTPKSPPDTAGGGSPVKPAASTAKGDREISRPRWSLDDIPPLPGFRRNGAGLVCCPLGRSNFSDNARTDAGPEGLRLEPLATPLTASGLSPAAVRTLAPMFADCGLTLLEGGAAGASSLGDPDAPMEPGSVLAVPLLTGDTEMSAVGTVTEVRGDRVFGFGHSFNNEGPIALPMGAGKVSTVVANLQTSFKLGALTKMRGTLTADQTVGVAGRMGQSPATMAIELRVQYADGSLDQTYHFRAAIHPKFTPLLLGAAVTAALGGVKEAPQYHTLDYDLTLDFADGHSVHVVNTGVNGGAGEVFQQASLPIMALADNPFKKVAVRKVSGTIKVSGDARLAQITSIMVPKLKYMPGETVKAFVTYRPWRESEKTMPVDFDLPKDLPNGQYQLVVSDWERYFNDEKQAEPFRFTAESIDELFAVVKDFEAVRHDALYVRLIRQPDGVAVGRAAMPRLPSSVREVLLGAGHSDMTAFVTSSVKTVPTDLVMSGAAEFALTIDRNARVESPKTGKPASQPSSQ